MATTIGTRQGGRQRKESPASEPSMPSCWNPRDKYPCLELAHQQLCVTYKGAGKHDADAGAVRTERPIPASCGVFYYEITIEKADKCKIGVGVSTSAFSLNKIPGWDTESYGYHGDDGMVYHGGSGSGATHGLKFGAGDVVGCGVNFVSQTLFFTKNGTNLGVAFSNVTGVLFPTVGLRIPTESLRANFGETEFMFDCDAFRRIEMNNLRLSIDRWPLNRSEQILSTLILDFLIHSGHVKTATAFANTCGMHESSFSESWQQHEIVKRQQVLKLVTDGEIDDALAFLATHFPDVLANSTSDVVVSLNRQKWIELVRRGKIDQVLQFGRSCFSGLNEHSETQQRLVKEAFSLLVHDDPCSSVSAHLLGQCQREELASQVNSAIMRTRGLPENSFVEHTLRHLSVLLEQVAQCDVPASAWLSLKDMI